MSRNNESSILADVAGCLLDTGLYDEGTEATEIYVLAVCEAVLHNSHELFNHLENGRPVDAGRFSYLVNYICFSHIVLDVISFTNTKLLKIGKLTLTLHNELITVYTR